MGEAAVVTTLSDAELIDRIDTDLSVLEERLKEEEEEEAHVE